MPEETLLSVQDLTKHFPLSGGLLGGGGRHVVRAVDGVSFTLRRGETLALVGESGCGKSTLGRCLVRLLDPTGGSIRFRGEEITRLRGARIRELRRRIQIIFQDPYASLNPRMTVGRILREPLDIYGEGAPDQRARRVRHLLDRVGLPLRLADSYPHELSGGQRQRVGIAAALALEPELIVADEPVSALDLSVQAQILNLLAGLQREYGLSFIFISHDLGVVRHISDRVAVMYLGRIVETAPTEALFHNPRHPYTQALLASIPDPDPRRRAELQPLAGELPSPLDPPAGCHFHPRCPQAMPHCRSETPPRYDVAPGHNATCFLLDPGARPAVAAGSGAR
ncbi:MAG TPA: ABC transporter ATP-binding protein [bacterium]|nr:ABC transporter ATP-binding protein [bacterium]